MKINSWAQEIKSKLDIVDVAQRLGIDTKTVGNSIRGWPCPTGHDSKSKTCFQLFPELNGYKCHHCDITGDIFHLIAKVITGSENDFHAAVEWISEQYGFENPFDKKDLSPEEQKRRREKYQEKRSVHALLKEACFFWHSNTPPEIFDLLQKKWGISRKTCRELLIGYASGEGYQLAAHLKNKGFTPADLKKSGLFVGKKGQYQFYRRRIIFPYWLGRSATWRDEEAIYHGEVVYLIGRRLDKKDGLPDRLLTENLDIEKGKYKKLRVHSESNYHISPEIRNDYLYGESIPQGDFAVITEGITDAITANQAGIPSFSPVTVRFKKTDFPKLLEKARKFKRVYICNDNEETKAGEGGALDTLRFLASNEVHVYLIELPLPEGEEKIDLCDFLRQFETIEEKKEAFSSLMKEADHAIEAMAKRIDPGLNEIERLNEAQEIMIWLSLEEEHIQHLHLRRLKNILDINISVLRDFLKKIRREQQQRELEKKLSIEEEDVDNSWTEELISGFDQNGMRIVKSVQYNVALILKNDYRWKKDGESILAFDEFMQKPVFLSTPPFDSDFSADDFEAGMVLADEDYTRICMWLNKNWGVTLTEQTIWNCVYIVSKKKNYHPVRNYLESVQWDGKERLDDWLFTYLQARAESEKQKKYVQLVGRFWLIQAVARIFNPGCKADCVLILEGKQGIKKSSAMEILTSTDWFHDTPLVLGNKDSYVVLRGSWIVEMAELDALMRAESSAAKAFFSSKIDIFRKPYGRESERIKRQCVFCGSVNHTDYIKDRTGGRRYWPVWCEGVEAAKLQEDRDQLWAEAVVAFEAGERFWVETEEEVKIFEMEQEARQLDDPWEELISTYLIGMNEITVTEIMQEALQLTTDKMTRRAETRVGQIMTRKKWERRRKSKEGRRYTFYQRPEDDEEP